jgi:hypothetical protein
MVDLMEHAGFDASAAISIDIPAAVVVHLATCADPTGYSGKVLDAEALIHTIDPGRPGQHDVLGR